MPEMLPALLQGACSRPYWAPLLFKCRNKTALRVNVWARDLDYRWRDREAFGCTMPRPRAIRLLVFSSLKSAPRVESREIWSKCERRIEAFRKSN